MLASSAPPASAPGATAAQRTSSSGASRTPRSRAGPSTSSRGTSKPSATDDGHASGSSTAAQRKLPARWPLTATSSRHMSGPANYDLRPMSDLLKDIQRDIRQRLDELRPLAARLRTPAPGRGSPRRSPCRAGAGCRQAPGWVRSPQSAPRPNRDRVLATVRDNPGATGTQIADASGVQRTVVYGVLRRLRDEGVIEKRDAPRRGPGTH